MDKPDEVELINTSKSAVTMCFPRASLFGPWLRHAPCGRCAWPKRRSVPHQPRSVHPTATRICRIRPCETTQPFSSLFAAQSIDHPTCGTLDDRCFGQRRAMKMAEWFHMGGFGIYVWPSDGLIVVGVALNVVWARRSARTARVAARGRIGMREESTS